jgi:hypothetical protein
MKKIYVKLDTGVWDFCPEFTHFVTLEISLSFLSLSYRKNETLILPEFLHYHPNAIILPSIKCTWYRAWCGPKKMPHMILLDKLLVPTYLSTLL